MIIKSNEKKDINRRYSLCAQIFIALILCLVVVNILTSIVVREVGSGFLFQQVDNQSKNSFSLLAATALDAVISEDQPILDSIATQTLSNSLNIIDIIIKNEKDEILIKRTQNLSYTVKTIRTYNYPILYENENFGSITITWNLDPIYEEIDRQITFVRYFISTVLIILSALIIQTFYWITIRPVNRISKYLTSLTEGGREPLILSFIASKELESLANAANDLFSEITQKEIREEQLIKTRQELQIAHDKALCSNQSKSNFLAVISHEIRTPMNAVLGIFGLLKDGPLTPKQRLLVQTGRTSGELLLTIINDILDFSKMESNQLNLEKVNFNIHELLEQTLQLLSHQARIKNIDLILFIDPNLPTFVNGDPDRVRQVLINLINNSLKFTPKGSIKVFASPKNNQNPDSLIIDFSVKDTGIGISDDLPYSLFDKFTMSDQSHSRSYEGTGLGLTICKHLVSLMNGDISYKSQLRMGTTFTFYCEFGISKDIPLEVSNYQKSSDISFNPNIRILLAEDNPANQFVIKQILNHAGLNVDIASNGQEALDILSTHPYDLVLMDISMPIMDGITTTQKIRQSNSIYTDIPIIALTAHALSGDRERYLHAGMNDYLQKPINKSATLRCIEKWTKNITNVNSQPILLEKHRKNETIVNYATIKNLIEKTSESHAFELITLYISDTHQRLTQMENAQKLLDTSQFTDQLDIICHSSITHGNTALHSLAKKLMDLHRANNLGSLYLANMELQQVADISLCNLSDAILSRYNQSRNNEKTQNN